MPGNIDPPLGITPFGNTALPNGHSEPGVNEMAIASLIDELQNNGIAIEDLQLADVSAVGAPTDANAIIGTDMAAYRSDRPAVDCNVRLPIPRKAVFNGGDLYHQQRNPETHCIGLQLLLDMMNRTVRSLGWPRLDVCRFTVNFSFPRNQRIKTYVFKFSEPEKLVINLDHYVSSDCKSAWEIRIVGDLPDDAPDDAVIGLVNRNLSMRIVDQRQLPDAAGPRPREERVIDFDE